jgi:uncharacterized protein YdbL (DUF1318 family)
MFANIVKWFVAALCGMLVACAVITVNVYFPEKDVKEAYKSLDDMLLKQGGDANKPAEAQPAEAQPAGGEPAGTQPPDSEEKKQPEVKPQSSLGGTRFEFSLVATANAADEIADELAVEMSSMPEVLKAYDQIRASIPKINVLRDSGAIGENKQGLLTIRDPARLGGNEALVKSVNESRKVVITGMAKAILKVNKQPATNAALNQVMGKAAAMFADVRHEKAKPGWWIELPNGRWVQK